MIPNVLYLLTVCAFVTCAAVGWVIVRRRQQQMTAPKIMDFERDSPSPSVISDETGEILYRNAAASALTIDYHQTQSIQDFLSHMVAEPKAVVFRVMESLDHNSWASVALSTRTHKIEILARRLPKRKIYWRLTETRLKPGVLATDRGLAVSVGRNGAVLSVSTDMVQLLGQKPKNVRDFFEWPVPNSSGPCKIRGRDGVKSYFAVFKSLAVGRDEITFFELSDTMQNVDDLFNALPIPLMQLDNIGRIQSMNAPASKFLENKNVFGHRIHEVFDGVSRPIVGWVEETARSDQDSSSQFVRLGLEDQEKFVQITISRINFSGQGLFLAVLNDATELKTLEAQFVQSQKMQAIGQLAGGVAHDFNNLLTAISGHCDLLLLRHGESDPDYADLDQIRQDSNRAAALVGQLLAFSRKQTLQPKPLDLEQTLSDHTHLLNRLVGEETTLTLELGKNVKKINADRRQFEQVIMNLVVNARDAMGGKGVIKIATSMRRYTQAETRARAEIPAGEYCVISVSDQGCGIDPEHMQRIFEPFYSTKKTGEGTGLGLSTVYGIVKQSGGFIFVDSVKGVGTTFEVLFPVAKQQDIETPKTAETLDEPDLSVKAQGVVLLVEDEAPVRAFASRALQLKGFTVLEASCAEEALQMLADKDVHVDIFVTDVVMPGVDGPTWVGEALKTRPNTKVVFVSGYAENRCDGLADNIPEAIFLPKPFSLNQLTSTVARLH